MKKNNLKIVQVPIGDLNAAPYNPRVWNKKAIHDLKKSIQTYGLVDAILVNSSPKRKNVIIAGHFRVHVAKMLGYTEVPVCYIRIDDIETEKRLNLTLNRVEGEWDMELLKTFELDTLLDVGFDSKDLAPIWNQLLGVEEDNFDPDEEAKKIKTSRVKSGDIYLMGDHKLICGDSTQLETVQKLVEKDQVSMLYCDPPYNISLNYDKGFGPRSKYGGQVDDSKSLREYRNLISGSIESGLVFLKKDAHVFYYCDQNYIWLIQSAFRDLSIKLQRVCLWLKNNQNPTPDSAFNKAYEPCVYGTIGKPYLAPINNLTEVLNKEIGTGNVGFDDLSSLWPEKRINGTSYEHPTEKPPTLHERPLRRCTKAGDIVLDLFGGSGSTMAACHQLKRKCFMVEKDPIFCEVILRRYEKMTGEMVRKIED